jgi:hypothetical protein
MAVRFPRELSPHSFMIFLWKADTKIFWSLFDGPRLRIVNERSNSWKNGRIERIWGFWMRHINPLFLPSPLLSSTLQESLKPKHTDANIHVVWP